MEIKRDLHRTPESTDLLQKPPELDAIQLAGSLEAGFRHSIRKNFLKLSFVSVTFIQSCSLW